MVGGMAHMVAFQGSDTVLGVRAANHYYDHPMAGFSIPAAEHSTITSWTREGELAAYKNMLDQFAKPGAVVAVVSDSYDLWHAIDNFWGRELRQQIIDSGAILVIRPDSGNPVDVVCEALQRLDNAFGHTNNTKNHKVLNHVRIIQGDGINEEAVEEILSNVTYGLGYSATNVSFGAGSGLLQLLNRDTLQVAFKCSNVVVNGQHLETPKAPSLDMTKRSKGGRLDLVSTPGDIPFTEKLRWGQESYSKSLMRTVYENSEILVHDTLQVIRERSILTHPSRRPNSFVGNLRG